MEEPKPSPPLPTPILDPLPPASRKRPFDDDLATSRSKIRALVRDLRPHFLQVLRTPDFRSCEAAHEIREKIKLVLEIQEQIAESIAKKKRENVSQPQSAESQQNKQGRHLPASAKKTEQSQKDQVSAGTAFEERQDEDGVSSTFIVGGSAFGWNFITYSGSEPVYGGVTKEEFRATMKDSTLPDSSDLK